MQELKNIKQNDDYFSISHYTADADEEKLSLDFILKQLAVLIVETIRHHEADHTYLEIKTPRYIYDCYCKFAYADKFKVRTIIYCDPYETNDNLVLPKYHSKMLERYVNDVIGKKE